MKIVSIDPGLDIAGLAAWTMPGQIPRTMSDALELLLETTDIRTSSDDELAPRLASLGMQLRSFLVAHDPLVVVVETPSFYGNYTGTRGRMRSVAKLYQAIGTILSRTGARTLAVPAPRMKKERRHELLMHASHMAGLELPAGPRGGSREDQWDAIWIGAQAILDGQWRAYVHRTREG